jgi:hypothetical protein
MTPRSIQIVQTNIETGRQISAELCSSYLYRVSEWMKRSKTPGEVLDAMLWGDKVATATHTYHIEH